MKMLIGGEFRDASDGKVLEVTNPYTGELIDTVPAASREDVERAIALGVEGHREWDAVTEKYTEILMSLKIILRDLSPRHGTT